VLRRVSLRRASGGILAAAVWIAIICATEIAVTDLYQVRTFAEEIYTEANLGSLSGASGSMLNSDLAIGVALIALLVILALWLMAPWMPKAASIAADETWKWRPARSRWIVLTVMAALLTLVVLLPLAGLIWKAGIEVHQRGSQFERTWSATKVATMIRNSPWEHRREWGWSFASGAMAAMATTGLAVTLAWWARIRPSAAITVLAPCIAVGFAVPAPLWGVWSIGLLNHPIDSIWAPLTLLHDRTLLAPVLVQVARALPLVGLWLWSQFNSVPQDLLEAARSEGAGPWTQLLRIALPLRPAGMAAALGIAFVLAISELSATLLVVPPGVTPISVRVFQLLHYGVDDRVAALALSVFALTAITMIAWRLVRGVHRGK
jgi:iron(III) transport system permease protein